MLKKITKNFIRAQVIILILTFLLLIPSELYAGGRFSSQNSTNIVTAGEPAREESNNFQSEISQKLSQLLEKPDPKSGIFSDLSHDLFWNLLSIILGGVVAWLLVILTEKVKTPSAKIDIYPELIHPDGRKFLKVKVNTYLSNFQKRFFSWQNPASYAKLKVYLIETHRGQEKVLETYTVKWDSKPEPWDYNKNVPRLELLPAASEPENFLPEDEGVASILVKHPNEPDFYIYDGNYYVNRRKISAKKLKVKLVFSSTSASATREGLVVTNNGTNMSSFSLKEEN